LCGSIGIIAQVAISEKTYAEMDGVTDADVIRTLPRYAKAEKHPCAFPMDIWSVVDEGKRWSPNISEIVNLDECSSDYDTGCMIADCKDHYANHTEVWGKCLQITALWVTVNTPLDIVAIAAKVALVLGVEVKVLRNKDKYRDIIK
jgi:hypothetical protein